MATKLTSLSKDERGPRQRTVDMANYMVTSMEKQHMWFLNYRGRKDVIMNLILHLNAQEHTLNTIQIAAETKRDSTSMTSIALLTMVFLPGTFTAVSITPVMSIRPLTNKKECVECWNLPVNVQYDFFRGDRAVVVMGGYYCTDHVHHCSLLVPVKATQE